MYCQLDRTFQHIAKFYNYLRSIDSYGRRLLGLHFAATPYGSPLHLTFQHRAGITPYTLSFDFAECCVFTKQSAGPLYCDHRGSACTASPLRHPISRSYGVILPSSLRRVISSAFPYYGYLPVSVYGTISYNNFMSFSRQ